jgi:hypothetical protein
MNGKSQKMTLFKAAQDSLLSSTPAHFTFDKPPPLGWWKAKFGFGLAAVAFVHHYQSILGNRAFGSGQAYWQVDLTARWQAAAGVTPKQWHGVKSDLGASGAHLVRFKVGAYGGTKGTWIRPSDQLLAVFGMVLNTYDLVVGLDYRIGLKLTEAKGEAAAAAAARPASEEELGALGLWTSRGGLARLRNPEYLGQLLAAHHTSESAA